MEALSGHRYGRKAEELLAPTPSLGVGFDSMSGEIRSGAISWETASDGTQQDVRIHVCRGMLETSRALKVDQSLALDFSGFVKVDQKLQFVRNSKATAESVSIVVYAWKRMSSVTAKNPRMKEVPEIDLAGFVTAYGDSYIDSIEFGGEYYAVYTFFTETRDQQESLVASLEAKGVRPGGSVKVDLQVAIDSAVKESRTEWSFDQAMSGIANRKAPDQDKLIQFALDFTGLEMDSPVVIGSSTAGYENVPGVPAGFKRIVANRRYFVGGGGDGGLAGKAFDIASLQNSVQWLKRIHAAYKYDGDQVLNGFSKELELDRQTIQQQFLAYADDPAQAFETPHPPLPSLETGTPQLNYAQVLSPAWGGDGGGPFSFPGLYEAVTNLTRLTWLRLRGGSYVDQLAVRYSNPHGADTEQRYGNQGGAEQIAITLNPGEFISEMNIRHGKLVDQIEIRTTGHQVTKIGRDGGTLSEWKVPEGCRVIGFQGRSGQYLDQLQAVCVRIQPCTFIK